VPRRQIGIGLWASRPKTFGEMAAILVGAVLMVIQTHPSAGDGGGDAASCVDILQLEADRSVLAEQRRKGPPLRDYQTRFAAVAIFPDEQQPVETVSAFQVGGTPLLWFTAGFDATVVNQAVFSDLSMVDVTSLPAGEQRRIGQVTELSIGMIGGRELLRFLVRAQILLAYAHIGADICIVSEEHLADGGYAARVTGSHRYFTNEEQIGRYAFRFEYAADGGMTVRGL